MDWLDLISPLIVNPFFLTGEALKKLLSGGRHRIRWWDHDDVNTSLGSFVLGLGFWLALFGAIWLLIS